jgi:nitrogen-specific signal transduction histidine kinase/CheY-like chemotaxis protein
MSDGRNPAPQPEICAANGPDAVCIHRAVDARLRFVSEAFCRLTGFSLDDLASLPIADQPLWVNPKDGHLFAGKMATGTPAFSLHADVKCKNGRTFSACLRSEKLTCSAEPQYLTTLTPLDHRGPEKTLVEKQLYRAQHLEAIGTLSSGIAHDFNNILTPIIIHSEMAMAKGPGNDSYKTHIAKVLKGARRAKRLIRQILAFSRQSEQKQQPFHPALIVKEGLKLLRATLPATIAIRQSIPADLGQIMGDPSQINQAFMNLCTNARHAMAEAGGTLTVQMRERDVGKAGSVSTDPGLPPGPYVELTVSDTGKGIDPHDLQRVFEPYYSTKGTGDGTGLGLAMVHGIVARHNGSVTVESERDRGTVFRLYFPMLPSVSAEEHPAADVMPSGSESLLFVDDEEATVIAMQEMLADLGYTVYATCSSRDALKTFRRVPERFDLVITDQTMPELTGVDLATEMMALRPGLPIILCTGYSDRVDREEAYRLGIREYVMKPLEMLDIATTIRGILDEEKPAGT